MENISQFLTATLEFSDVGGTVPEERDSRGWRFVPDRAEVNFVVSPTGESWMPLILDLSGSVYRQDGGKSTVRRHRVWAWDHSTGQFVDPGAHPVPAWAVAWVRAVCPQNNVPRDPTIAVSRSAERGHQ